tara:strand:+ start:1083 stop:1457 length:375 start_codon:yes stop_codon:yes gene_type:complete
MKLNQITLPVSDIPRSKAFYEMLGFGLRVSSPHYCRFVAPDGDATLSIHVETGPIEPGAVLYLEVDDVDATVATLEARGLVFETAPVDQSWLWREADFRDPDGHRWKIYHAGKNRLDPPWAVSS